MNIIGIHDGQNAAVALVMDGRLVRFAPEKRFRHSGEYAGFPRRCLRRTLKDVGLTPHDIDHVVFAGHTMKTPRTTRDYLAQFAGYSPIAETAKTALSYVIPGAFRTELRKRDRLAQLARNGFETSKAVFVDAHLAASMLAYNSGPGITRRCLILCAGKGEDHMGASVHVAQNGRIERIATIHEDDSLGNLLEHVTYMLGMAPQRDEQLLMDLGAMAEGDQVESAVKRFDLLYGFDEMLPLNWQRASIMPESSHCQEFLKGHFRRRRFDHIAGGFYHFLCRFVKEWVHRCAHKTEIRDVLLCGDLFELGELLPVAGANHSIISLTRSPLPGVAGNAIGAAFLLAAEKEEGGPKALHPLRSQYFGRRINAEKLAEAFDAFCANLPADVVVEKPTNMARRVADLLAAGALLARFAGPEDLRLRGLGNRNMLCRADHAPARERLRELSSQESFWSTQGVYWKAESLRAGFNDAATLPEAPNGEFALTPRKANPWYGFQEHRRIPVQAISHAANPAFWEILDEFEKQAGRTPLIGSPWRDADGQIVRAPKRAFEMWVEQGLSGIVLPEHIVYRRNLTVGFDSDDA